MGNQKRVDNHLMVDEFVALGKLDYSVQREHLAKSRAFKNMNILKLAFSFKYFFFKAKDIPFTSSYSGKRRFNKPLFWIETNFHKFPLLKRRAFTFLGERYFFRYSRAP